MPEISKNSEGCGRAEGSVPHATVKSSSSPELSLLISTTSPGSIAMRGRGCSADLDRLRRLADDVEDDDGPAAAS